MIRFTAFNIVITLFFVFAWSRALLRYRERAISWRAFLFWTLVWGLATYFIFLPNKADFLASVLGVSDGKDAVFTLSIVIIFYLLYRIYAVLDHLDRRINEVVQESSVHLHHLNRTTKR
ncbi:MAG: DUF2304 family protein [Candidatus Berkelbacteria bacterium]|nr:MAG: DUF2304 family protein [Candidatus Berkelbacteria bacterium]QQG51685.1 MAG: DUF2304 family protein [Candidatus Berkelbacteria bacterium]